ncbi:ArfGap-domain-containing protein [Serendipita vermifera]|nr:ArfGap-domain-containing protein [Serendipita vermifera]
MSTRQDKATTDRNARTLRELVKLPQNKFCADCKKNGSGCFVCIRCSGIHRSMGTHISKVKSVDLDVWTSEQLASVQKWGNTRVNLYWEAHLKPGHVPPDHKMDSFIRSKYESRRWAMEGPPPSDPSSLEQAAAEEEEQASPSTNTDAPETNKASNTQLLDNPLPAPPVLTSTSASARPGPQISSHNLLSSSHNRTSSLQTAQSSNPIPTHTSTSQNDLFSLDFSSSPAPPPQNIDTASKKDVKQDILALFSNTASVAAPPVASFNNPLQQQQPAQSLIGSGGPAAWGADSWSSAPSNIPGVANIWANSSTSYNNLGFASQDIWGSNKADSHSSNIYSSSSTSSQPPKKSDSAFDDLWGNFK